MRVGLKLDRDLGWVGTAVEDREGDFLICLVEIHVLEPPVLESIHDMQDTTRFT